MQAAVTRRRKSGKHGIWSWLMIGALGSGAGFVGSILGHLPILQVLHYHKAKAIIAQFRKWSVQHLKCTKWLLSCS